MTRAVGRVLAAAYVATVAGLTAAAFSSHDVLPWAEVAVGVLTLPAVLPALPVVYVLGAFAWTFSDSPASGTASSAGAATAPPPVWPVALTFTASMTLVAIANVALIGLLLRRARRAP